jgi:hypothetical protein
MEGTMYALVHKYEDGPGGIGPKDEWDLMRGKSIYYTWLPGLQTRFRVTVKTQIYVLVQGLI